VRRTRAAEGELRKLIKGRYNVRHYQIGSVILALMVIGRLLPWYINGKLPYLLVGLNMTAMVAVSASLSSTRAKSEHYTHIVLNQLS